MVPRQYFLVLVAVTLFAYNSSSALAQDAKPVTVAPQKAPVLGREPFTPFTVQPPSMGSSDEEVEREIVRRRNAAKGLGDLNRRTGPSPAEAATKAKQSADGVRKR